MVKVPADQRGRSETIGQRPQAPPAVRRFAGRVDRREEHLVRQGQCPGECRLERSQPRRLVRLERDDQPPAARQTATLPQRRGDRRRVVGVIVDPRDRSLVEDLKPPLNPCERRDPPPHVISRDAQFECHCDGRRRVHPQMPPEVGNVKRPGSDSIHTKRKRRVE